MVFLGICGPLCSGKSTVVDYLVKNKGFQQLSIQNYDESPIISKLNLSSEEHTDKHISNDNNVLNFASIAELDRFVCQNWTLNFVIESNKPSIEYFTKRPFFLLANVDAPMSLRYKRFADLNESASLDKFIELSDECLQMPEDRLPLFEYIVQVRIWNNTSSVQKFYTTLEKIDLLASDRFRPSWDNYFMTLANLTARRSNCMKRRVGCVLVKDCRILSTGYNGTPRGMPNCCEGGCERCNLGSTGGTKLDACLCLHAEENALLEAGKERINSDNTTLYTNTCPCLTCSVKIAQVGIREVVYSTSYSMDEKSAAILKQCGVILRQYHLINS